jgi:hypothetical protein
MSKPNIPQRAEEADESSSDDKSIRLLMLGLWWEPSRNVNSLKYPVENARYYSSSRHVSATVRPGV